MKRNDFAALAGMLGAARLSTLTELYEDGDRSEALHTAMMSAE